MSKFTHNRLSLDAIAPWLLVDKSRQIYIVTADFGFKSDKLGLILVPKGSQTDFASVPKVVKSIVDDDDPDILWPSVIHDYLYSLRGKTGITRAQADDTMLEAMCDVGCPWWKRNSVWSAVKTWGWTVWMRDPAPPIVVPADPQP